MPSRSQLTAPPLPLLLLLLLHVLLAVVSAQNGQLSEARLFVALPCNARNAEQI